MQTDSEELVATLVHPDEYSHHLNQVASVTTKSIIFLKRKFISKSGSELVSYPISDCVRIIYKDERPLIAIVSGVLLILLIAFIFYNVFIYWNSLEPGTRIPIGLLGFAMLYGYRWVFGSRRHRFVFVLKGNKELIWKSRFGDHKYKSSSTRNVIEFAKSAGIFQTAQ